MTGKRTLMIIKFYFWYLSNFFYYKIIWLYINLNFKIILLHFYYHLLLQLLKFLFKIQATDFFLIHRNTHYMNVNKKQSNLLNDNKKIKPVEVTLQTHFQIRKSNPAHLPKKRTEPNPHSLYYRKLPNKKKKKAKQID